MQPSGFVVCRCIIISFAHSGQVSEGGAGFPGNGLRDADDMLAHRGQSMGSTEVWALKKDVCCYNTLSLNICTTLSLFSYFSIWVRLFRLNK